MTAAATAISVNFFGSIKNYFNKRKKLAITLSSEIKAFKTVYDNDRYSYRLKKDPPQNGTDIKIVRLECNYVVTFDNNTDKLGLLDEEDISEIISFYMELKSLIDTLMVLATRWERYIESYNTLDSRSYSATKTNKKFSEML